MESVSAIPGRNRTHPDVGSKSGSLHTFFSSTAPMRVRVSRVLDVNGVADGRDFAGNRIGLAIAGPCHVIDLFEDLAALGPALDNLNAIEVARRQGL